MSNKSILSSSLLSEKARMSLSGLPFSKLTIQLKSISCLSTNSITKICEVFSISKNSLKSWARKFDQDGIEGLYPKRRKARKSKLSEVHKIEIKKWISKNPSLTLQEIQSKLSSIYNVKISQVGIWKNLKKMGLSYITARKKHYKSDKSKQDEFKKNFKNK